jgi:ER-bound oxygenase mpaB/B'/Rubber oxygenase, catalytic domain
MPHPQRLIGLDAARARFGDQADRIAAFFSEGDALADAAVLALDEMSGGRAVLRRAIEDGIDAVSAAEAPAALVALFRQLEHVPFWVDHERCSRGGRAFVRCGPFGGIALGFGSLARAYCSSGGNKPLAMTGALVETAARRISNTGRFLHAVAARDGLRRGAVGYRHAVHVRLMHARIRVELLRGSEWRVERWGAPINQADMALTALLFSYGFAGFVRKLGVRVTEREAADLLHLWRYGGYLMGVSEELLCATPAEAQRLADLVDMMDSGPDEDSRRLLDALLRREPKELKQRSARVNQLARRVFAAACRDMIGPQFADYVGLPDGPGDLAFRYLLRPAVSALGRVHGRIPGAAKRADGVGERYWTAVSGEHRTHAGASVGAPNTSARPLATKGSVA